MTMIYGKHYFSLRTEQMVTYLYTDFDNTVVVANSNGKRIRTTETDMHDINIFFMDESNKISDGIYVPNWEVMMMNANSPEEIAALEESKELFARFNDGFRFRVCHTIKTKVLKWIDGKQEWKTEWTIYQHPWYTDVYGNQCSKQEVLESIEGMMK